MQKETTFKIFYSWQSDLPSNNTRGFIQECIEAAARHLRNTVAIEADRDTKGEYGSPDIVETIFSKIDECDLFIADTSIVNKYFATNDKGELSEAVKLSPNPNVLLELGYAAKTLSWSNVICIMNTDYGEVGELPFDLEHRRPVQYSLKESKKSEVREYIRNIIVSNVLNIMENGVRPKDGLANHLVGSYLVDAEKFSAELRPLKLEETEWYKAKYEKLKVECQDLIKKVQTNVLSIDENTETDNDAKSEQSEKNATLSLAEQFMIATENGKPVVISNEDKAYICEQTKALFDLDLNEEFFCLGNLRAKLSTNTLVSSEYIGTESEKTKYDDLNVLSAGFYRVYLLESFAKTFTNMLLFPLAVCNNSTVADEDITVAVSVDSTTADIVIPSKKLLFEELCGDEEYTGLEGFVYDEGFIKLLMMPENGDITYDTDISFSPKDIDKELRKQAKDIFGNYTYKSDAEDYEDEIKKFVATPMERKNNTILFEIKSLRANEKKWLGPIILVIPKAKTVRFSYTIKSKKSNGTISSELIYKYDV